MKYLHIAICEDNFDERKHLLHIVENSKFPTKVKVFDCGESFLSDYQRGKFDLVFMDIYMSGITGIETITAIRELDENISIAFTTSSTDHTLESYRLNAIKYIEKPVSKKSVYKLLELALLKKQSTPELILRVKGQTSYIPFERILYVEQKSHTLYFFLTGNEVLTANEKLDNIIKQFEGQSFFRCHKSYVVNFAYVKNLDKELMVFSMKNGSNVHIRRESMPGAKKAFESYLFKMARGYDYE